jgi:hypothetical protein
MTIDPKGDFLRAVEEAASRSRDIDELAAVIRSLPGVQSVEVGDYLVKTEPPMRELAIQYRTTQVIADITLHHDGTLTVRSLHDR